MEPHLTEAPAPLEEPWAIVRFFRRWRRTLLVVVVLAVMAVSAWGASAAWRAHREGQFEQVCRDAQREKQWAELERVATAWSKASPNRALPWVFLANAQEAQNNLAGAATTLDHVPDQDPLSALALLEQSTLYLEPLNQPQKGAQSCQRALAINPRTVEARQRLIFFYSATLQRRQMVKEIRQAIALHTDQPENYVHLIGADWLALSNGFALNSHWLETDPNNETYLVARAVHYLNGGTEEVILKQGGKPPNMKEALAGYRTRFPANLELICYDLEQARNVGDTAAVIALLRRAPPEAETDNRFWRYRGWLENSREQFAEAEKSYRKALSLNPFDWRSQLELADVLRRLERFKEVQWFQGLALEGRKLHLDLIELSSPDAIDSRMLSRMSEYAAKCGDNEVSVAIRGHAKN